MALHIDSRPDGQFALFIDGDLQFDTSDEALYHEGLALPALCLASNKRPKSPADVDDPMRILICGGGDGLALRECLRFPGVGSVDLVDCSSEVVEFGRTRLSDLNAGAFNDPRVNVHIEDAWDFLAAATPYDVILCDFTVPRQAEDTRVFTAEWYAKVSGALTPTGAAGINAISPQARPDAFWCLRRTIRAAGLSALPYRVCIPSYRAQGYGPWAFFAASRRQLTRMDLTDLHCPVATRQLDLAQLPRAARFTRREFAVAGGAPIHSMANPCLMRLLISPDVNEHGAKASISEPSGAGIAFGGEVSSMEPYDLQSLLNAIPIAHAYHTRDMVEALAEQVTGSVRALDIRKLVDALLDRAARLPAAFLIELNRLKEFLRSHAPRLELFGAWTVKLYATLIILLTLANAVAPDNAFGKGSFGLGHVGISRGYSSFGGRTSFSSEGRVGAGSFESESHTEFGGGSSGSRGSFRDMVTRGIGRQGGSFEGRRGFGSPNSAFTASTETLRGAGFRSGYGAARSTDIYGYEYEPRLFSYNSYGGGGGYGGYATSGGGYGAAAPPVGSAEPEHHKTLFVADDDLLVLDNGDVVVTLADSAYILVHNGATSLMSSTTPTPLVPLYSDPAMFQNIAADIQGQQIMASQQIRLRRDWLSWVGWTEALFEQTKIDRLELNNLQDLERRLNSALDRLGSPAVNASPTIAPEGAVELFAGCLLLADDDIAIREPNRWIYTDGVSVWNDATAAAERKHNCPPALTAALRAVLTKLQREFDGDRAAARNDLLQLETDRYSLEKDLADYTSIFHSEGNDSDYEVDYGTDSITVSDALSRTKTDLVQNQMDTEQARKQIDSPDSERIARALPRFGR